MTDKDKIKLIQRRNSDVAKRLILLAKEITSDAIMTDSVSEECDHPLHSRMKGNQCGVCNKYLSDLVPEDEMETCVNLDTNQVTLIPIEPVIPLRRWCSLCGRHIKCMYNEDFIKHVQDYHSNIH